MAKAEKNYLPSYRRAEEPPPLRVQRRDEAIVLDVYAWRLLSSQQIEALHFPPASPGRHSRRSACQRRLQLLYHHRFLDRLRRPIFMGEGRAPFVYALDTVGANLVAAKLNIDRGQVLWKPKDNDVGTLFLEHTLAVNDVRVVINRLVCQEQWAVEWVGETELKSKQKTNQVPFRMRGARKIRVIPDGYFALRVRSERPPAHFFLEVDRGTMSNTRWQKKVQAYKHFRMTGLSQKYYESENFRVLAVTTSVQRLENLKRATEKVAGKYSFWFTTQDQVDIWQPQQFLDRIWSVAGAEGKFCLMG